jgi:predicted MFS family arabinose efflux permease
MAAGGLGAIMATAPVQAALDLTSWRQVFLVLAAMSLVAALAILLIVPREERSAAAPSARDLFSGTGRVFASRTFWRIAPLTVASQATFFAIQGLWAGPWLTHVAGLPRAAVARQLSLVAAAMIAGFLILGWTAERLGRKGVGIIAFAVGCMLMFMAAQLAIIAGWGGAGVLPWLAFGFFGTSGILPYAGLSQRFPAALAGRVNTSLNVLVFVAAFAAQAGMGAIIDWQPAAGAGTAGGYRAAFALMLLLQGIGLVWFLVCRHDPPVRR